jgi:hypothetical protein
LPDQFLGKRKTLGEGTGKATVDSTTIKLLFSSNTEIECFNFKKNTLNEIVLSLPGNEKNWLAKRVCNNLSRKNCFMVPSSEYRSSIQTWQGKVSSMCMWAEQC